MQEKDIFDRIMALPGLRLFEAFYYKRKQLLIYLFFGGLTFFINFLVYVLLYYAGANELAANIAAWIVSVLFAFYTNKYFVFQARSHDRQHVLHEILSFTGGRLLTLLIEEGILFLFITKLGFHSLLVKICAQIIVIILNFVVSKFFVFH